MIDGISESPVSGRRAEFANPLSGTSVARSIHRSAWNIKTRKFICSILQSPAPIEGRGTALPLGKHRLVQMDYLENSSTMG
jgi:hypothetical protein